MLVHGFNAMGPLESLQNELEYNASVSCAIDQVFSDVSRASGWVDTAPPVPSFYTDEFKRAIREGAIGLLDKQAQQTIIEAYRQMETANAQIRRHTAVTDAESGIAESQSTQQAVGVVGPLVESATKELQRFLGPVEIINPPYSHSHGVRVVE